MYSIADAQEAYPSQQQRAYDKRSTENFGPNWLP